MGALLALVLAALLALPMRCVPSAKPEEPIPAPTQAATVTPEPIPTPTPEPETRRIADVIEGTVQQVFDGYFLFVYKNVAIQVNISADTVIEQIFTRGTDLRITHSGEILMTEPMQITADRIEPVR